jgi:hypothetical protein
VYYDVIQPGDGTVAFETARDVNLPTSYPTGDGNTVTVNADGSLATHHPTSDVGKFGDAGLQENGLPDGWCGTLTDQLIDNGQCTDQCTWQGNDGSVITIDSSKL